jgi:FkbM family methyltransferase
MQKPSLLPPGHAIHDLELLRELRGRRLSQNLRVLCVIGAHRFDELPVIDRLFPKLEHIYLFEPLQGPLEALHRLALTDRRLQVFPVAVSDRDGHASFHIASNNGESSSLLAFGSHRELFPEVSMIETIEVSTRRLDSLLAEYGLDFPDVMIIDVQGAEFNLLKSFGSAVLDQVRLIYSEVSTEHVYESSGLLSDVEILLSPRFVNLGYAPLRADVPMHGNAVFVAEEDIGEALALTVSGRMRRGFHRWKRLLKNLGAM